MLRVFRNGMAMRMQRVPALRTAITNQRAILHCVASAGRQLRSRQHSASRSSRVLCRAFSSEAETASAAAALQPMPANLMAMYTFFYENPQLEYPPLGFAYHLFFDAENHKMYQIHTQWFGALLRKYPAYAQKWIFGVMELIARAAEFKPKYEPTEEQRVRWIELLIIACRAAWDVPEVRAAVNSLLAVSSIIPDEIRNEVQELLVEDFPFDFVRSFAMGPVLTGPYLEMLIDEEREDPVMAKRNNSMGDFLINANWAHFYATGEDLPIKILLKLAAQLPELTEPELELKKAHVARIQSLAIQSLEMNALMHLGLIKMYENIMRTDKSFLRNKHKMTILNNIISSVNEKLLDAKLMNSMQQQRARIPVSLHFQAFLKQAEPIASRVAVPAAQPGGQA